MPTGPEDLRREVERSVAEELRRAESIVIPSVAQIEINIEPRAIPRKTADPQQMISVIQNEFSSRYDPSNIRKYVPAEAWVALSAPRAMEIAINNDEIVQFVGGWLRLENLDRMTPISRFGFAEQTLFAQVEAGTSEEALFLCKRLAVLLWQAAGIERRWDELEPSVEFVAYKTSTVVDLGVPLIDLLSSATVSFLKELCQEGGTASYMGSFESKAQKFGPLKPMVIPHCREIDIRIAVVDPVTGQQEEHTLDILLHTRSDANRSRVKIVSALDSTRHNEMVLQLVAHQRKNLRLSNPQ
jgi:hypothetical protein